MQKYTPDPIVGTVFGRLTVRGRAARPLGRTDRFFLCACECGNDKVVALDHLLSGHTKSCGCLRIAVTIKRLTTHGMRHDPVYQNWAHIVQRCCNRKHSDYPDYGARGIGICEQWRNDFAAFRAHIGPKPTPKHSVERLDNQLGYIPGNVTWATNTVQSRNRRSNRLLVVGDETRCVSEWAERCGINAGTVRSRLTKSALGPAEALSRPPLKPLTRPRDGKGKFLPFPQSDAALGVEI